MMDGHLKALADVSLAVSAAEAFLDDAAHLNARDELDRAAEGLTALRAQWPDMPASERTVVGATAAPLRDRLDAARARLPKLTALTDVTPEPGERDDADAGPADGDRDAAGRPDPPPATA